MSTDAGSAAAPEDTAVENERSERPGLESADPNSADSATSTPETADSGVHTSAGTRAEESGDGRTGSDDGPSAGDTGGTGGTAGAGEAGDAAADEGFVAGMLRDATVTGLPGETGAPPAEPHAPQAQQQGDEPVGSEPAVGDNPRGAD
jgi:hypothetical protein